VSTTIPGATVSCSVVDSAGVRLNLGRTDIAHAGSFLECLGQNEARGPAKYETQKLPD